MLKKIAIGTFLLTMIASAVASEQTKEYGLFQLDTSSLKEASNGLLNAQANQANAERMQKTLDEISRLNRLEKEHFDYVNNPVLIYHYRMDKVKPNVLNFENLKSIEARLNSGEDIDKVMTSIGEVKDSDFTSMNLAKHYKNGPYRFNSSQRVSLENGKILSIDNAVQIARDENGDYLLSYATNKTDLIGDIEHITSASAQYILDKNSPYKVSWVSKSSLDGNEYFQMYIIKTQY